MADQDGSDSATTAFMKGVKSGVADTVSAAAKAASKTMRSVAGAAAGPMEPVGLATLPGESNDAFGQ